MRKHDFEYNRDDLIAKLKSVNGKTLEEADTSGVFKKAKDYPKITGIAGDVIEQSVLGYSANSDQQPDIIVNGLPVEVKTTGIKYSTASIKRKRKPADADFEAKEPMSVTAVSPQKIIFENFDDSNFWHKLKNMLLIYYHYDSQTPVKSWDYKKFIIKGYEFHEFSNDDKKRLKNDWLKIQKFIQDAQKLDDPTQKYPSLGKLRKDLLLIDTAPKWPNPPRFRLKRSTVTAIVQEYFGKKSEHLNKMNSMSDIDHALHLITNKYSGLTVKELLKTFKIPINTNKKGDVSKSIAEQILLKMFNSKSKKLNNIDVFNKSGMILKTLVQTTTGGGTEDTKLFKIDFTDFADNPTFEDSQIYNYFSETQFIFIIFKEPNSQAKLLENKFCGFKRVYFDDNFLYGPVKKVWCDTKDLIDNHRLVETPIIDGKTQHPVINEKTGIIKTKLNFMKSKDNAIFLRGSGKDSAHKPLTINGIHMYYQFAWIKKSYISRILNSISYI